MNSNHEPKRIPCVGWSCEGGFDTDSGTRIFTHASTGRSNWRRKSTKHRRINDKRDTIERTDEATITP